MFPACVGLFMRFMRLCIWENKIFCFVVVDAQHIKTSGEEENWMDCNSIYSSRSKTIKIVWTALDDGDRGCSQEKIEWTRRIGWIQFDLTSSWPVTCATSCDEYTSAVGLALRFALDR